MGELYAICQNGEIDDGSAVGFTLMRAGETGQGEAWSILITRKGNNFYAFENNCPHQKQRLDTTPGEFLDEDGNFITCGHHGAQFDLDTGKCFIGPCQGQSLTPIECVVDDGDVCITGVQLVEEDGLNLDDSEGAPETMITGD